MMNFSKFLINLNFILIGAVATLALLGYFFGGLLKYQKINKVIETTSQNKYNEESYNCINFSQDAATKLQKEGIGSNVIVVENADGNGTHAVVSVWLDPQNNNFVANTQYLGDYKELKTLYGWTNR